MRSSAVTVSQDKENCRVIVTGDGALIRFNMVGILTEHGFEVVREVADGEEAVKLALELEPDLIVMDIKIPRLDEISTTDKIMKEAPCAIAMLTAFSDKELIERAKDAGTMAYLARPFQAEDLIPAAEVTLPRHQGMLTLENSIADSQDRLTTHRQVDRAEGLLMEKVDLSEPGTLRQIQKTSMDRRLSICEIADTVIKQLEGA